MEKRNNTHIFKCGKCNAGEIVTTHEFDGETNTVYIKKCSNDQCKHQYYFKELIDVKLEKISKTVRIKINK